MSRTSIYHALGLHMHQPPGNLRLMIEANPWEAEQIIRCYERPARYALQYKDVARLHVGFSGVLLEQLMDPGIIDRYRHILDIPEALARYAEADNIELIGMGYYHPIFPLIPRADWAEQLERGRWIMERAFGRAPRGFWPPEMAFSMEMIPALVEAGYEYVVVDGVHVRPEDGISDVFRPYSACHEGVCITVIPRDRDVSNAQESGLDPNWFQNEVRWRVGGSPRPDEPRLVTTWSDGENGGWFRQTHEGSGFFGHFFAPYMEHFRGGEYPITPVSISDHVRRHPPVAYAQVQTGAWNIGANSGADLSQWAGSETQRGAVQVVDELSRRYWGLRRRIEGRAALPAGAGERLAEARRLVLEAETSCFLFWGDAWLPHLYERTAPASSALDEIDAALAEAPAPVSPAPVSDATSPGAESPRAPASPAPASVTPQPAAPGPVTPQLGTTESVTPESVPQESGTETPPVEDTAAGPGVSPPASAVGGSPKPGTAPSERVGAPTARPSGGPTPPGKPSSSRGSGDKRNGDPRSGGGAATGRPRGRRGPG
jgi:hypothetical protein